MNIAVIISLVGMILRLVLLNQSFWLDEGASFQIASSSYSQIIKMSLTDFHPPFFYTLLHTWLAFVNPAPEWLIRLPFVILSALSIYLLFILNKNVFGDKNKFLLFFPSLLLALNPFHIYYSQELRMYSLNTILAIITWIYLIKLNKKDNFTNKSLFVLFTTINLYTFYGAFFNLFSQFVYWIYSKKSPKTIFQVFTFIFLCFLPWLPQLLKQMHGSGVLSNLSGWKEISGMLTLKDLFLIPTKILLGRISIFPKTFYYLISTLAITISSILIYKAKLTKKSFIFLCYLFIPITIAAIVSLKTPVLGYWRYLFITPALFTLLTLGINNLRLKIKIIFALFYILLFISANIYFWTNPQFHREDWQGLSSQMNTDKSLIVFNFTGAFAPLSYYLPNANYYPTQTHLGQVNQDRLDDLVNKTNNYVHIYYLDYLSDLTDPDRKTLKYLKDLNLKQVQEKSFNGIGRLIEFEVVK